MTLIIGLLLLTGLILFKRRNTRLHLESKAAAEAKERDELRLRNLKHGILEAVAHRRNRDDYERRAAESQTSEWPEVKYR